MITLGEVMALAPMAAAAPVLRTSVPDTLVRRVRWVHSSEVLAIAPLLRGGELLLTGGQGLFELSPADQAAYVLSLGARGITALAVETAGSGIGLTAELIAAAQEGGLPLIELCRTAPFVDIAEEVNSLIVNEQARTHLLVDDVSRRIAHSITEFGPHLPTVLQLLADGLSAETALTSAEGVSLGRAGTFDGPAETEPVRSRIVLSGQLAAELTMRSAVTTPADLEVAADRLSGILGLALAPSFKPSVAQIADTRLMQAIVESTDPQEVADLWVQAGLPHAQPAVVAVFRTRGRTTEFSALERTLRRRSGGTVSRSYLWDGTLTMLFLLPPESAAAARGELVQAANHAAEGTAVAGAFGPPAGTAGQAHGSYTEAQEVLRLVSPRPGSVLDALDFLDRRILAELPATGSLELYVQALIGDVLAWDRKHGTQLAGTLLAWLESGCNITATAAVLHIERQTMHKRVAKIVELLGADPRTSGTLFTVHLALRMALRGGRS